MGNGAMRGVCRLCDGHGTFKIRDTAKVAIKHPSDADIVARPRPKLIGSKVVGHDHRLPPDPDRLPEVSGHREGGGKVGEHKGLGPRWALLFQKGGTPLIMLHAALSPAL
jgi:hypothetical protein